jgi:DNA-binding SARP family transcriptional activator/TolB-like protein
MLQPGTDSIRHVRQAPLRLRLLGRFEIVADHPRRQIAITSRKARALILYLAMHLGERVARTHLTNLLWGDRFDKQAKQSLRQCLSGLRQELGELGERALIVEHETVMLDPAIVAADAIDFLAASKQRSLAALRNATLLYSGDLTADFDSESEDFAEWSRITRERLRTIAIETFEVYLRHITTNGDRGSALEVCERLLALDPLREATHRLILPLEASRNGRCAALQRFQQFETALKRELGVAPERATLDAVAVIRNGESQRARSGAAPVAPDDVPSATDTQPPSREEAVAGSSRWIGRAHPWRFGLGAAGLVLIALAALRAVDGSTTLSAPSKHDQSASASEDVRQSAINSIVVLPFASRSEDERTRRFADLLTEELTADLSHTPLLVVISRQTAIAFRETNRDAREIGKELGVNYLLTGSVTSAGGKTMVRVQLTDTRTGVQVWTDRIERDDAARYEVFEEIIHGLGRRLAVEIYMAEGTRRARLDRGDPTYADLIHRGFAENLRPSLFDKDHSGALELFEEALRREPKSASAMIGITWILTRRISELRSPDRAKDLARADELMTRAVEINPEASSARFFHGVVRKQQGRVAESIDDFEHALRLNPNLAAAHAHLGQNMTYAGRAEEAEDHIRKAIRLSPRDPSIGLWQFFGCEAAMALARYDAAIEWCEKSTAADPQVGRTYVFLAAAYARKGENAKSVVALRELQRLLPNFPPTYYRKVGGAGAHPRFIEQRENVLRDIELAVGLPRS